MHGTPRQSLSYWCLTIRVGYINQFLWNIKQSRLKKWSLQIIPLMPKTWRETDDVLTKKPYQNTNDNVIKRRHITYKIKTEQQQPRLKLNGNLLYSWGVNVFWSSSKELLYYRQQNNYIKKIIQLKQS